MECVTGLQLGGGWNRPGPPIHQARRYAYRIISCETDRQTLPNQENFSSLKTARAVKNK